MKLKRVYEDRIRTRWFGSFTYYNEGKENCDWNLITQHWAEK